MDAKAEIDVVAARLLRDVPDIPDPIAGAAMLIALREHEKDFPGEGMTEPVMFLEAGRLMESAGYSDLA